MILDVILGENVDTSFWIKKLRLNFSEHICVINYDYYGEPVFINGVMYLSVEEAKEYFKKFDSICFYKSIYIYPGMYSISSSQFK